MTEKKKHYDLAEEKALTLPVIIWRFCAYKSNEDYESGDHYFMKDFLDHAEMKVFSSEHSAKEKPIHPGYCSMYWKIELNVTRINKELRKELIDFGRFSDLHEFNDLDALVDEWLIESKTIH
jgi:hypothetical protein